jgi:two-component system cell cycle response regulator DivK
MSKKVLVVEDQEDNRKIIRDLLTTRGFEVIEAINGVEGLQLARSQQPDLILMDIQLPGMQGYEVIKLIKAEQNLKDIPIFVVTSYAMSGDAGKAFKAGCNAYFAKPYSPRELLAKIQEILN